MEAGETESTEVAGGAEEEESVAEEATEPVAADEGSSSEEGAGHDPVSKLEARLARLSSTGVSENGGAEADASEAREVSATTIGRMMGLATSSDLKLMEGKLDLLSTRVNNLTVRMEKVVSILSTVPSGSDLERIDMQIGSLRVMLREVFNMDPDEAAKEVPGPGEKPDRPITSAKIVTNTDE